MRKHDSAFGFCNSPGLAKIIRAIRPGDNPTIQGWCRLCGAPLTISDRGAILCSGECDEPSPTLLEEEQHEL